MGTEYLERLQTVTGALELLGLRVSHLLHYSIFGIPVSTSMQCFTSAAQFCSPSVWYGSCSQHMDARDVMGLFSVQEETAAACLAAVGRHVRQHFKSTMQADFSQSVVDSALAYIDAVPLPFLRMAQSEQVRSQQHCLSWCCSMSGMTYIHLPF